MLRCRKPESEVFDLTGTLKNLRKGSVPKVRTYSSTILKKEPTLRVHPQNTNLHFYDPKPKYPISGPLGLSGLRF